MTETDTGKPKDFSTAIMDRKKAPHKLQVEDSKQDDNSVVEMTQAKMDELKIFKGDAVILKGKNLMPGHKSKHTHAEPLKKTIPMHCFNDEQNFA